MRWEEGEEVEIDWGWSRSAVGGEEGGRYTFFQFYVRAQPSMTVRGASRVVCDTIILIVFRDSDFNPEQAVNKITYHVDIVHDHSPPGPQRGSYSWGTRNLTIEWSPLR